MSVTRHALAPANTRPFSTSPSTECTSASLIQYGVVAGTHGFMQPMQCFGAILPFDALRMNAVITARPGSPAGLATSVISSFLAFTIFCLNARSASHSVVAIKRVAIWTPLAPIFNNAAISSRVYTPPAANTGMLVWYSSSYACISCSTSQTSSESSFTLPDSSSSFLKPRCPPARLPSTTMKSGQR